MDLLCKHHRKHNGEERTHEHNSEVELAQTFYYTAVSQTIYALINHLSKGTNKASYKLHRGKMTPNSSVFLQYVIFWILSFEFISLGMPGRNPQRPKNKKCHGFSATV